MALSPGHAFFVQKQLLTRSRAALRHSWRAKANCRTADRDHMATTTAAFVIWNQSWCIGVRDVDAQHQNLVALVNKLNQAMSEGKGKNVLEEILESLVSYTKAHFRDEERLMEQSAYPDILDHKRQHVELTKKVLDFQKQFKSGASGISIDILQFLGTWLKQHILGTDAKYVALMHSKGIH
jgi:hemerythrin